MSVPASLEGIYNQLFPPQERDEVSDPCNDLIRDAISWHLPELEELLGLQQPQVQFRNDVLETLSTCICVHTFPPNRPAHKRKELAPVNKAAASAVRAIRLLNLQVRASASLYPPIKQRFLQLGNVKENYAPLLQLCQAHAKGLTDRGG